MSAEDVRCAVEAFIAEVGAIQDEVVVSYLANYLLEVLGGQPEDDALMDLRDVLEGFVPEFAELQQQQQQKHLVTLVSEVGTLLQQHPAAPAAPPSRFLGGMTSLLNPNPSREPVSSGCCATQSECGTSNLIASEEEALGMLRAMCPGTPPTAAFLLDVLRRRCAGSIPAAAEWLLQCVDSEQLQAEERAWEGAEVLKREAAAAEAAASERARRITVQRYHLEAVPAASAAASSARDSVKAWGQQAKRLAGEKPAAVRYRDGAVVSTKGDKFVIEKPPEWDGGSRGKVKSKRKGGVGWH